MLSNFLAHGLEVSDMCRLFREYWAISTRNEVIDVHVKDYYNEMILIWSDKLCPVATSGKAFSKTISMLISFVEGYSITARSMPEDIGSIANMLTNLLREAD